MISICREHEWTGFRMIGLSIMKGLRSDSHLPKKFVLFASLKAHYK